PPSGRGVEGTGCAVRSRPKKPVDHSAEELGRMTTRIRHPLPLRGLLAALSLALIIPGCDKPRALGDANQILVVTPTPVWNALETDIQAALEPRTFTVRDERVFDVAQ